MKLFLFFVLLIFFTLPAFGQEYREVDLRVKAFFDALNHAYKIYSNEQVLDLYVICFSVHTREIDDGILSMWRGYGNKGKGGALVFDTSKLPVPDESPLVLGAVWYATQEERKAKISQKIDQICTFISSNIIPDVYVSSVATALFGRLCLFSVFSKHIGFKEENEWRLVYFIDRDQPDGQDAKVFYEKYFSYFNSANGIQPKLKLPVGQLLQTINA